MAQESIKFDNRGRTCDFNWTSSLLPQVYSGLIASRLSQMPGTVRTLPRGPCLSVYMEDVLAGDSIAMHCVCRMPTHDGARRTWQTPPAHDETTPEPAAKERGGERGRAQTPTARF